jgi:hypothetical protein
MAGTLTISTLKDSSGVLATQNGMTGICKAWVNFNGTGTVAIRDSFNVSSITDNGTGNYAVNFTTAMANANYVVNVTSDSAVNNNGYNRTATTNSTTAAVIQHYESGGTATDTAQMCVSILSS